MGSNVIEGKNFNFSILTIFENFHLADSVGSWLMIHVLFFDNKQ